MNMEFQMIGFNENLTSWTAIPFGINQLLTSKVMYSSNILSNVIKIDILKKYCTNNYFKHDQFLLVATNRSLYFKSGSFGSFVD